MENLDKVEEKLKKIVLQAGKILKKYFQSGKYYSKSKGGVDFMTEADLEVEKFLIKSLAAEFPETSFLTEEKCESEYGKYYQKENLWVIDPLDGTINFSRGNPHFAISIGLVDRGKAKLGLIYLPVSEMLYFARADSGNSFLNNKPIHVSKTHYLKEATVACDWAWDVKKRLNLIKWLTPLSQKIRQVKSMGSGAADLASLAEGRIDGYIHAGLKPWDIGAALLIIEKAGGKITDPYGKAMNIFNPDIFASNNILHDEILKLITQ